MNPTTLPCHNKIQFPDWVKESAKFSNISITKDISIQTVTEVQLVCPMHI